VKQIRTAALSRHSAPAFVLLGGLELMQLRKLGDLAFRLFVELLALADHATGRVDTSYAVLLALLDFDQAHGAHAATKPTLQRVRTALEALIALQLVRVDRIKNEKAKGLFLRLPSRAGISTPDARSNRLSNRPQKAAKPATARVSKERPMGEQQTEQQGVQENSLSPLPPSLSTGQPAPSSRYVQKLKREIEAKRAARGNPLTRAPEGA